jgi:hypothetical protein
MAVSTGVGGRVEPGSQQLEGCGRLRRWLPSDTPPHGRICKPVTARSPRRLMDDTGRPSLERLGPDKPRLLAAGGRLAEEAEEYDAAQERGEVASATEGRPRHSERECLPTLADAGLTAKDIFEARRSCARADWIPRALPYMPRNALAYHPTAFPAHPACRLQKAAIGPRVDSRG